jgi:5-methylcytosine-specific restriction endonuclease McrA
MSINLEEKEVKMVTFKKSIFKNETERLSFMQNFLKELIRSSLLDKAVQHTKMANGEHGCYLSHHHGRLPKLMSIGVYTYEDGDYAFLRFWEFEDDEESNELISKREFFLEKNENKVKELLGNKIVYESNNRRRIGNFSIEEDDYWDGFCAHGEIRKSQKQLRDDLLKMAKVLELMTNAERNQSLGSIKTLKQLEEEFESEVANINLNRHSPPNFDNYRTMQKRPVPKPKTVTYYNRDPQVVADALWLAKGVCQGCGADKNSLFRRASDGEVYLEVHHIQPLSEGGSDTLNNACALCPTCHRLMHYGKESEINRIKKKIFTSREKQLQKLFEEQQCD